MTAANTDEPTTAPGRTVPSPPTAGDCPAGGNHAPIPVQGGQYNVCAKCGQRC